MEWALPMVATTRMISRRWLTWPPVAQRGLVMPLEARLKEEICNASALTLEGGVHAMVQTLVNNSATTLGTLMQARALSAATAQATRQASAAQHPPRAQAAPRAQAPANRGPAPPELVKRCREAPGGACISHNWGRECKDVNPQTGVCKHKHVWVKDNIFGHEPTVM